MTESPSGYLKIVEKFIPFQLFRTYSGQFFFILASISNWEYQNRGCYFYVWMRNGNVWSYAGCANQERDHHSEYHHSALLMHWGIYVMQVSKDWIRHGNESGKDLQFIRVKFWRWLSGLEILREGLSHQEDHQVRKQLCSWNRPFVRNLDWRGGVWDLWDQHSPIGHLCHLLPTELVAMAASYSCVAICRDGSEIQQTEGQQLPPLAQMVRVLGSAARVLGWEPQETCQQALK